MLQINLSLHGYLDNGCILILEVTKVEPTTSTSPTTTTSTGTHEQEVKILFLESLVSIFF